MLKPTLILFVSLLLQVGTDAQADVIIQKGDKIAFLGDSITQAGAKPGGYCQLIVESP